MPVEEHTLFSARSARTFLDCGYTMCFGAASAKSRIDAVVKNAINAGDIPGPRALANAAEMAPHDGALVPGITRFVETPEEIEAAINEFADQGADQIKLSMSGEEITEVLRAEDTTFPDELVAAGVEVSCRTCGRPRLTSLTLPRLASLPSGCSRSRPPRLLARSLGREYHAMPPVRLPSSISPGTSR